jgi:hypothetical protein
VTAIISLTFDALGRDIKKYTVQYKDIYNINKLGAHIWQGKEEKALTIYNKAAQYEVGKAFNCKSVIVIKIIYADSLIIPSLIIFKGKTY